MCVVCRQHNFIDLGYYVTEVRLHKDLMPCCDISTHFDMLYQYVVVHKHYIFQ
jgi:hypothetical protein